MSANSGSLPRQPHLRNHSHSVSSGSLISNHRVSRRKSVSSNAVSNVAAMVAAVREAGDSSLGIPISNRRNTMSKTARSAVGSLPSPPASLPSHRTRLTSSGKSDRSESAIDDDQIDEDMDDDDETGFEKSRMRRASEGQHLMKDNKKGVSGDLKCEHCGKGYKHSSCLSKHKCVGALLPSRLLMRSALESLSRKCLLIFELQMGAHTRMVSDFEVVSITQFRKLSFLGTSHELKLLAARLA